MIVLCKAHPFQLRATLEAVPDGLSVAEVSARLEARWPHHQLFINGRAVSLETDAQRQLADTDLVVACVIPAAEGFLATFLISLAVSVALTAVTVAVTILLRPKVPGRQGPQDAQRNSLTGIGNQPAAYEPIPKGVGRTKMFPKFPGKFPTQFTEIVGDDQFLRGYVAIGTGPVTIPRASIKLGQTPIDEFDDVELEIFEGKPTDPPNTLYTRAVIEETLSVTLTAAAGWQERTTEPETTRISVDWAFPRGLQHLQKDGDRKFRTIDIQIEAQVGGIWVRRTGILNQLPDSRQVIVWSSDSGDTRIVTVSGTDSAGAAIQEAIPLNGVGAVWSTLNFRTVTNALLAVENLPVVVTVAYWTGAQFVTIAVAERFRTVRNTNAAVRRNASWDVASGQYPVRLRRLNAPGGSRDVDDTVWIALRSFKSEIAFTRPTEAGIAFRLRASDQLNGIVDNLNCVVEWEHETYDGTQWTAPMFTQNPAWGVAGVLIGNGNRSPIPASHLDAQSFLDFAAWCDAEGFQVNHVWEAPGNVEDVAQMIAATGRGSLDRVDGRYVIVIDKLQPIITNFFTPYNTWGLEGSATYPEEVHGKRIAFLNEELDWAEDERIVYADGYSAANATLLEFIRWEAVTKPDLIFKHGRYELANEALQFERWSFSMDFEQLQSTRGSLGLFSHDGVLIGLGWGYSTRHEFAPTGGRAITIDNTLTFDPAKTYGVEIRQTSTGDTLSTPIVTPTGPTNRLLFTAPLPGLEAQTGDLVVVGEWGSISQRVIVKSVEPIDDNGQWTARLTVAPEAPGRYTADQGPIPPHVPIITVPTHPANLMPPTPIIRAIRSDETASVMQDDGAFSPRMVVSVTIPSSFSPALLSFQIQFRPWIDPSIASPNPHAWQATPIQSANNGELIIAHVEVIVIYEVRARAINMLNTSRVSPWSATVLHTVLGDTLAPDMPTAVTGSPADRGANLSWQIPLDETGLQPEVDFAAVEIWMSATNDRATATYLKDNAGAKAFIEGLTNGVTAYFWLRSRDWAGNLSAFHAGPLAGLAVTPTANVMISTGEVLLASKDLAALGDIVSLNYQTHGGRVLTRGKLWIDAASNDPSATESAGIVMTRNGVTLDGYTLSFTRLGPGYPGELNFVHDDGGLLAPATYTYALAYAGSGPTARAIKISLSTQETET